MQAIDPDHRSAIYRWFAGLFAHEQTTEALSFYSTPPGETLLDNLSRTAEVAPVVAQLRRVTGDPKDIETRAGDLAAAFAWLFSGYAGRYGVPPYESAFTGEDGRLFQGATDLSGKWLRDLDVHVAQNFAEPADHISIQLSIMAELIRRSAFNSREEAHDLQGTFLKERLCSWVDAFCDAVVSSDKSGFYATAASCLADFIAADLKRLQHFDVQKCA